MSNGRKSVVIEQLRRELELVLASEQEPLPTVKEVAKRLGYSCATLYEYFPEMCHAIANRRRRPVDFNGLHRELEAILAGNHEPYPSLREVIERLGCPGTTLHRHFPEQCRAIVQRHRHGSGRDGHLVTISAVRNSDEELEAINTKKSNAGRRGIAADIDGLRTALEEVLTSRENPPPTMKEVAGRLGYSGSVLYHYFPRQCRAIAERHRGSARQRIDRLKHALEEVLTKKEPPFPTVQEVAKNLGCSDGTLYHHFPEYCHAIAKRHQLDRDFIHQSLAAILASDDYPPSVSEVARGLGCSIQILSEYFPQECKEIKARHWKLADTDKQRQMLEAVLASDRPEPWSFKEIAQELGCSRSTLYRRFPELCREILKSRWKVSDTDHLRQVLEAALLEDSPPTLRELAGRLGCSEKNIQYYFPDLCRAVTARRRAATDWVHCQGTLERALESSEEPVSMQEVARRLGASDDSLRNRFPTLCSAISTRYLAYRKNRRVEKIKRMRDQVRQATLLLHARGEYPNKTRVAAFLDSPARFRNPEVRDAWHETMRELGYEC